jgi:hypothetical protein
MRVGTPPGPSAARCVLPPLGARTWYAAPATPKAIASSVSALQLGGASWASACVWGERQWRLFRRVRGGDGPRHRVPKAARMPSIRHLYQLQSHTGAFRAGRHAQVRPGRGPGWWARSPRALTGAASSASASKQTSFMFKSSRTAEVCALPLGHRRRWPPAAGPLSRSGPISGCFLQR